MQHIYIEKKEQLIFRLYITNQRYAYNGKLSFKAVSARCFCALIHLIFWERTLLLAIRLAPQKRKIQSDS